jgi:general stress protein 26
MSDPNAKENYEKFFESIETVMLTSQDHANALHTRPMAIADKESHSVLWFATSLPTEKVDEIALNPQVSVTYQSSNQYLAMVGKAMISNERGRIETLWNDRWAIWFPKGPTDPDLRLIKFEAESAEYWDNAGTSGLKYLYEVGRAFLQKEKADVSDSAIHGEVKL